MRSRYAMGAATAVLAAATMWMTTAHDPGSTSADISPEASGPEAAQEAQWHIRASGARIIGGYGDNFAYDGENVRPVSGTAEMRLNPEEGTGKLTIRLETTSESGPIHFAEDTRWEGEIEIVKQIDTSEMDAARIATDTYLHGNTGNEAPVMPRIYNYFATWGPSKIHVNGEEAVPMIGSHTMFTEQARGSDGMIRKGDQVYNPKLPDKTGFTNSEEMEFHYVAHTTEPDKNNFPPHTAWIHLHFSNVEVVSKPSDASIPYTQADD